MRKVILGYLPLFPEPLRLVGDAEDPVHPLSVRGRVNATRTSSCGKTNSSRDGPLGCIMMVISSLLIFLINNLPETNFSHL